MSKLEQQIQHIFNKMSLLEDIPIIKGQIQAFNAKVEQISEKLKFLKIKSKHNEQLTPCKNTLNKTT